MSRDEKQDRQLSLFGAPPTSKPTRAVGPATVPAEIASLATRLPAGLRLGTSSWSFPGWEGLVYDRAASKSHLARKGLAAYARHPLLHPVGIDRTFYAPITATAFAEYASAVPDSFRFLVKASGECTSAHHRDADGRRAGRNPRFLEAAFAANEVVGPFVEGLGDKAGPLVFQFPPLGPRLTREPPRFAERLGEFLAALPRGPLYAVELRDGEMLGTDYFAALEAAGAIHCYGVHTRMPPVTEQWRLAGGEVRGPLVVRWMLHCGLQYEQALERYEPFSRLVDEDPASRAALADLCVEHVQRGEEIVIVANNKAEGSAPWTVFRLAAAVADRLGGPESGS
jgi:uncharacterized protein YecE (DUF72 family)